MLDSVTKRRIDTARDILVGKVPDPKSQVEQITIALIYKFMDDMDAESEELGGERKFFAGEFAKYGWAKLMRSGLGGHEMLGLYGEAITRMPENPGIPPLFRDIFKNAYLPYRDPETLRAFLKIIDDFEYDHSERLGDAFEYLLSVLGSQGDAGQFRTPRHIIDFIVSIVDLQKDETVLDPACGTAGFLISSYKHIVAANRDGDGNSTLTPDDRTRLAGNFRGYDISPDMVRLSLANMYLHGFTDPHIYEYDTLTSQDRWNEYADVILANPPFMSPTGGIKPHNRFSVQSKRSEVLFVDYMAEHLTPNGRAGIIVPEGIIFQSQTAYAKLRKLLVEDCLVAVVSMPAGVFNPYSGVKTCILILDKALAKQAEHVGFFKIGSDGFGLGAQRRPIGQSDLPQASAEIAEYLRRLRTRQSLDDFTPTLGLVATKEKIAATGDYSLNGERYRDSAAVSCAFPQVELGALCRPEYGYTASAEEQGDTRFVRITDIAANGTIRKEAPRFTTLSQDSRPFLLSRGDLLVARTGATYGKTMLFDEEYPAVFASYLIRLRFPPEKLLPKFYWFFAQSREYWDQTRSLVTGGGQPQFNGNAIKRVRIPLPPLDVQEEIVAEIEGYQKVVDGAQAVLDNYCPAVLIDSSWPVSSLGEVSTLVSGQHIERRDYNSVERGVGYLTGPSDFGPRTPLVTKWTEKPKVMARAGDVLIAVKGSGLGKVNLLAGEEVAIGRQLMAIRTHAAMPEYVYGLLCRRYEAINALGGGAAIPGISRQDVLDLEIPLAPLEVQAQIAGELEAEERAVMANRMLADRFREKIENRLAALWELPR